jgi:hypothetical protein
MAASTLLTNLFIDDSTDHRPPYSHEGGTLLRRSLHSPSDTERLSVDLQLLDS